MTLGSLACITNRGPRETTEWFNVNSPELQFGVNWRTNPKTLKGFNSVLNINIFLMMIIFADIEPFSGFSMWIATIDPAFHTGLFTLYPYRGTLSPKIFITFFII